MIAIAEHLGGQGILEDAPVAASSALDAQLASWML
jgi:hypothetical protein